MRIIFIFGVLLNHTTTVFTQAMSDATGWAHMTLLSTHLMIHFTRMGFMFMTGLVLTLNYYHRDDWKRFYQKRFAGSGWPYLLWNFLLLTLAVLASAPGYTWANFGETYWLSLIHGNQFYMYYILVTLQLYIIYPLIVWLFKKLPTRHHWILAVSFLFQLALMFVIKYAYPHFDRSTWPWWFASYGVNVFTYQFYFIFGAYVSLHYQDVTTWINKHIRPIAAVTLALCLGTVGYYFWNRLYLGFTHTAAVSPHQPYMLFYDTIMIVFVFWIGKKYAAWRGHGCPAWFETFVKNGAKVSFGIYLDQTIGLMILSWLVSFLSLPDWGYLVLIPLGYLFVIAVSFGIAWFCYKVPPFGLLIGRPQWHVLARNRRPKQVKGVAENDRTDRNALQTTEK